MKSFRRASFVAIGQIRWIGACATLGCDTGSIAAASNATPIPLHGAGETDQSRRPNLRAGPACPELVLRGQGSGEAHRCVFGRR